MNWNKTQLLAILPQRLRKEPFDDVRELRLRAGQAPRLITMGGIRDLSGPVQEEELRYVINAASRYSPWNASSMKYGYLTAPGGHRIGVCGEWEGEGLQRISSLCIRVARDVRGIALGLPIDRDLLILGPPGSGKTTLLRDHIRILSRTMAVAVVDERGEIFPEGFSRGMGTDVLTGLKKAKGTDMVLRSMGPEVIAMDEVTEESDCAALLAAARCGVRLVATAHAASVRDLIERTVYRPLAQSGLFSVAAVLDSNRNWHLEEVGKW